MLGLIIYQHSSGHMFITSPTDFESSSSKNQFIIKRQLAFPVFSFPDLSSSYNPYTLHLIGGILIFTQITQLHSYLCAKSNAVLFFWKSHFTTPNEILLIYAFRINVLKTFSVLNTVQGIGQSKWCL